MFRESNVKRGLISLILVPVLALCACNKTSPSQCMSPASSVLRIIVDQAGRTVEINNPVERIVSGYYISSSACIALGLSDKLAGIEAKADSRPIYALAAPELLALPNVGTAKEFNLEGCIALEPDLVILPVHLRDSADIMTELGIPVILVNPEGYDELLEMITLIGDAAGAGERAERLLTYYGDMRNKINDFIAGAADKPVVHMCGVGSYLTTAPKDMYQSVLIGIAGGQNAAREIEGNKWTPISYEQLLAMDPEVIIIPSEAGYDKKDILADEQLAALNAVINGRIYQMPDDYEAWDSPVPSSILGMLWLVNILHGDVYSPETLNNDVSAFYNDFYGIRLYGADNG